MEEVCEHGFVSWKPLHADGKCSGGSRRLIEKQDGEWVLDALPCSCVPGGGGLMDIAGCLVHETAPYVLDALVSASREKV